MSKRAMIGATLLFLGACSVSPRVQSGTVLYPVPGAKKVFIDAIEFYSDKEFTVPAPAHWYMATSRQEIRRLAGELLPGSGFELVEWPDPDGAVRLNIDLCITGGPFGVASYIRARVYYREAQLLEITGNAACPSLRLEAVRKQQREMAEALIKEFSAKMCATAGDGP